MKKCEPCGKEKPLAASTGLQLSKKNYKNTRRTPEEAEKVFEDNFRREDDEEELKKKIKWLANFPLCQIKRSFLTRSAVPGLDTDRWENILLEKGPRRYFP